MEDNQETKALSDLIQNPQEISNIINNPADNGMKFYQSLRNKDKQYVAFAAGIGLIAYGFFLNRGSKKTTSGQVGSGKKNKNKGGQSYGGHQSGSDASTASGAGSGYGGSGNTGNYNGGDHNHQG
ncbi:hypothetical protein ACD591_09220 [Rufibacter glacialis]|uniref:Uncharacterized protein n=1 Tax=Rufibacter glacialis TaxID=1259555 RepID=A0ABV4REB4_9BACT|nr:hypothetical protein [Rufibacter glacialis]GGK78261.1 hypothetical protein GCM10011405_27630 [Rufibacter glacialis]